MDLKKKVKGLSALARKGNGGFTLVELIVVIAILAILAGVGAAAYNGYMEKANQAADETLIAEINRAAALAVLEGRSQDMESLNPGQLSSSAVKNKPNITVWETYSQDETIMEAFARYFADNEGLYLKWYGSLRFDGDKFVGVESILKGGLVDPTNGQAATAFNASSYAELGVSGMTEMVDTLSGALSEYGGLSSLTETAAFEASLEKLGIDPDTADAQTKANASVFYLADYMSQIRNKSYVVNGETKTGDQMLWEQMKAGTLQTWLVSDEVGLGLNGNDATFFNTAIQYAAATAYAYSGQAPTEVADIIRNANPTNNGQALGIVQQVTTANPLFWNAYKSSSGKGADDFSAFLQVMEVVNASGGSFSTIGGSGLFSNGELQEAINGILGRS